jgi:hypothetical protein
MLRVGLNREDLIYGVEYNLTSPYTAYRRDEENYLRCDNRAAARRRWAKVLYCSPPRTAAVLAATMLQPSCVQQPSCSLSFAELRQLYCSPSCGDTAMAFS